MPATAEEEWAYWDAKAIDMRRTQLSTIQSSAARWSTLLTALLGVFGTVAFAGGLVTIDKLGSPYDVIARTLTTAAAIAAVIAIGLFARVNGGLFPKVRENVDGDFVNRMNTTDARAGLRWFRLGRISAVTAAVLVLTGSLLVLWRVEATPEATPPSVLVAFRDGVTCGKLSTSDGQTTVGGQSVSDVTAMIVVATC